MVLRGHLLDKRNYRSLTLIDPVALSPWGTPLPRYARQHESIFAGLPDFIQRAVVPAYIEGAVFTPLSAEAMALYAEPGFGPLGQPAFWRQIAQFDEKYTNEIESKYDSFRCPVMILWGKEDKWISVDFAYKLAAKIAGSRLKIVPNAGHIVQEDAPEAIILSSSNFFRTPEIVENARLQVGRSLHRDTKTAREGSDCQCVVTDFLKTSLRRAGVLQPSAAGCVIANRLTEDPYCGAERNEMRDQ
ncbi:alpha/beta hydrolase [Rhizobium lentis]|uniref:Alpha/beta hydrolase n=2 Tax=Rhizobium lentis TaxID=1138194 RepID=A0ABS7IBA7_9HYPH|nr:alpha/beta hydrolase [Rhizobium lentis]